MTLDSRLSWRSRPSASSSYVAMSGRRLVGDEPVDADDRPLARFDLLVDLERLVGDQALQVAVLDGAHHAAVRLEVVHDLDDLLLGRVGERLDEVGAAERIGHRATPVS